jgi:hypothetical protein
LKKRPKLLPVVEVSLVTTVEEEEEITRFDNIPEEEEITRFDNIPVPQITQRILGQMHVILSTLDIVSVIFVAVE